MFFTEKELEYLKGTAFIDKIIRQKSQMKRDYDNLILNMPEYSSHSFEDFCSNGISAQEALNDPWVQRNAFS